MFKQRQFIVFITILMLTMLVALPVLSQEGKGKKKDKQDTVTETSQTDNSDNNNDNKGNNNKNKDESDNESTSETNQDDLLGCQKNNPDRLDCSSLEVSGYCDGNVAVFTIRNTGESGNGDMRSSTSYRIEVDGNTVQSGDVQLNGGATMEVRYDGGGTVTLYANQQVGHPGNSRPQTTLTCESATPEPTEEPTEEPTPDPTEEPTPEPTEEPTEEPTLEPPTEEPTPELPALDVIGECWFDNSPTWTISNSGGDMVEPALYEVFDISGMVIDSGDLLLSAGDSTGIAVSGYGEFTLVINGGEYSASAVCDEPVATEEPTPDVPALDVIGECWYDDTPTWTISNSGGDMVDPAFYEVFDISGMVIDSASFMLTAGDSIQISVGGYGEFTLVINGGEYSVTAICEEPVATEEPTPELLSLDVIGDCWYDDTPTWIVSNTGGDMLDPAFYQVFESGVEIASGELILLAGDSTEISVGGYGEFTLVINGGEYSVTAICEEPVATEEPTPDLPLLDVFGECWFNDTPTWTVSNSGGDMVDSAYYEVFDISGMVIDSANFMLIAGDSIQISVGGYGEFTLVINGGEYSVIAICEEPVATEEPTPDPTEEPTPDPTEEPTPDPTEEPTPDPTEEPTPEPPLGCQKNNPDRLDCSSLAVTGYCDGSVAVFTITNTGEAGNGDMRAPTAYNVMVDAVIVESGEVQINGGTTMEVRYEGGGTVTLYADQQIGHPGKSHPQTTLTCA